MRLLTTGKGGSLVNWGWQDATPTRLTTPSETEPHQQRDATCSNSMRLISIDHYCHHLHHHHHLFPSFPSPLPSFSFTLSYLPPRSGLTNQPKRYREALLTLPSEKEERHLQRSRLWPRLAANAFLAYLEPRERVWWLQMPFISVKQNLRIK